MRFVVPHYFKLSDQSFVSWISDYTKSLFLSIEGFIEGYALLFLLIRKYERRWPIFICAYQISLVAFNLFLYPTYVAPLYNRYTAMPECVLRDKIERLAQKAQFSLDIPIMVQDASKQTKTINARVEGFGPSTRIVIWDNAINNLPEDETVAILAHEMGHYRLHHIYWNFLLTVLTSVAIVPINMIFAKRFAQMLPPKWGIRDLGDWAITPAFILVSSLFSFISTPVDNFYSRSIENQADLYALKITNNGPAFANAMIHMGGIGLDDPNVNPFVEFWLFDHPSIGKRVELANQYTLEHPMGSGDNGSGDKGRENP